MNTHALKATTLFCAVAAALALSACQKRDGQTAGEKLDSAVSTMEQKADQAGASIKQGAEEAKQSVDNAMDKAGDTVKDASITTKVNAELAGDSQLSALKINVDTANGHVVLKGVAPNEAARDHATTLAQKVEGVLSVDNQLTVGSGS